MYNQNKIRHISIVPDGNRRWAKERGLPEAKGHTEGTENLKRIANELLTMGIPYLTAWGLSTENLENRSKKELDHLFYLFGKITDYLEDFFEKGARLNLIGDIESLPPKVASKLFAAEDKTRSNDKMMLTLAINYGGRDEIVRSVRKMIRVKTDADSLTEQKMSLFLDTSSLPEVDLVIRPGGYRRLSGWLPWQTTYAELYFTDVYWPDFDKNELHKAIDWYNKQKRNRGR